MIGRASEQPGQDGNRHEQPEIQGAAADTARASIAEEPDLELGLLKHQSTDTASVLHSITPDKERPYHDR